MIFILQMRKLLYKEAVSLATGPIARKPRPGCDPGLPDIECALCCIPLTPCSSGQAWGCGEGHWGRLHGAQEEEPVRE